LESLGAGGDPLKEQEGTIQSKKPLRSSVNQQGLSEDTKNHEPKSKLENLAKKKNTKI